MRLSLMPMLAILMLALVPSPALADDPITGTASIIDADTLEIAGTRIRLNGVDAIEDDQRCTREGEPWDCAAEGVKALDAKIAKREVACVPSGKDRYGRTLAICTANGDPVSLNEWLVCQGWAVAFRRYSKQFIPCEDQARKAKLGIWSGEFMMPEQWRRQMRGDAAGGLMKQGWLSVFGLLLDIVGFLMVALEWRRCFMEEWRERARSDSMLGATSWSIPAEERHVIQDQAKVRTTGEMIVRRKRFWLGTGLVVLGFLAQMLGSVPGGIPWLGIVP